MESMESEESVLESGKLRTNGLGVDVRHLVASPEGAWSNFGGGRGRSSIGWVVRGYPYGDSVAPAWGCSHLRTKGGEVAVAGLSRRSVESREGCLP
ncbi:hypothetical protein BHE74_00022296 [Ensete ventricosum]|nr:hypothetical protein BHE74_00022296 [Ensete ventricosum]